MARNWKSCLTCGLIRHCQDINGKGLDLFNEDLDYAKKTKSYYFSNNIVFIDNEIKNIHNSLQPYEKIWRNHSGIHTQCYKNNIQLSPESLFQRFNNMTVTEYAYKWL
jgi:hypothetical protein